MFALPKDARKWMALLGIPAALSLLFAGCSGKPRLDKNAPVTSVVWHYYIGEQKKAFDELVNEFNVTVGQDKGIIVEAVSKADVQALNEQITGAVNNEPGSEPLADILFAYADIAYTLAQKELLVDYTKYVDQAVLDEYVSGFLDEGRLYGDERLYILPVAKSTEVLVVNRTYFGDFLEAVEGDASYGDVGLDSLSTWEGILAAADAYYRWSEVNNPGEDGRGRAFFGLDSLSNFLYSSHKQLGGDLAYAEDGKGVVDFSAGDMNRVWHTYYTPMVQGHFAAYGRFRSDDFKTGDILAYLGSVASAAYLTSEVVGEDGKTVPIELEVLPMPVYEGAEPVAIQQAAGMAVTASIPEKEYASTIFVTWFSETERNIDFAAHSSYMPVRLEAVRQMAESYDIGPESGPVDKVLSTALVQVGSGYRMYTPPVFEASYDVRSVLESNLRDAVQESIDGVRQETASGTTRERVMEKYLSDDWMQRYIDDCAAELSAFNVTVKR